MASQEEKVEGQPTDDTAEFSGAWDGFEAEESGQPAAAAGRQDDEAGEADQGGDEAGQGEAQAGQPEAGTTPAADASKASRDELPDDVLANADPRLKARLEQLETERLQASNLARSNGGRLAQALNELQALKAKLAPEKSGDASGEGQAQNRDERLEQLREEYPEVASPILDKMAKLEERVEALTTSETARAESAVADALADEHDALLARHPDLPSIVADPAYAEWVKAQTPAIQRIVQENAQAVVNADDAALVFDLFKQSRGRTTEAAEAARAADERRKEQLEAGRTVAGRNPTASSDARPNGGTYGESWDEFEQQDRRKAAGRK